MAKFLVGEKLSKRIQKICGGSDVRCAVAFWGKGAGDFLFDDDFLDISKIICDISMGGTNPDELKRLGVPDLDNIRHIHGLHTKVYISDEGVVVGSANASNNALHYQGGASGHMESGVFHAVDSKIYKQCCEWFDDLWDKKAKPINQDDLNTCAENFKNRKIAMKKAFPPNLGSRPSILEVIRDNPELFENVKFIISNHAYTSKEKDEADEKAQEDGVEDRGCDRNIYEYFGTEFDLDTEIDGGQWPLQFIDLYWSKKKMEAYFYTRGFGVKGTHFAQKQKWMGKDFKVLKDQMTKICDESIISKTVDLDEFFGNYMCLSAQELQRRLFP